MAGLKDTVLKETAETERLQFPLIHLPFRAEAVPGTLWTRPVLRNKWETFAIEWKTEKAGDFLGCRTLRLRCQHCKMRGGPWMLHGSLQTKS